MFLFLFATACDVVPQRLDRQRKMLKFKLLNTFVFFVSIKCNYIAFSASDLISLHIIIFMSFHYIYLLAKLFLEILHNSCLYCRLRLDFYQ